DLIIEATAHGQAANGAGEMMASIEVGSLKRYYRVLGDRRCIYKGRGSIAFSRPARFQQIRMRYEFAYGGLDPSVEAPKPKELLDLFNLHPGIYPRNHVGRGYVVHENAQRLDGLLLPNIENPEDPLTPDNLVAGGPENWWRQPLPWS